MTHSSPQTPTTSFRPLFPSWAVALALAGVLAGAAWMVWGDDNFEMNAKGRFERVDERAIVKNGPPPRADIV